MRRHLIALGIATLGLMASATAHAQAGSVVKGALPADLRGKAELVFVDHAEGTFPPTQAAVMNQLSNTYKPHVLPVMAGSTVQFKSGDPEIHNVFARGPDHHVLFNQAVLPNQQMTQTFTKLGVVKLTCNVHKSMLAFVVVFQNPFWSTPDAAGKWKIVGLPAGHYDVRVWGEDLNDATLAKTFPIDVTGPTQSQDLQIAAK